MKSLILQIIFCNFQEVTSSADMLATIRANAVDFDKLTGFNVAPLITVKEWINPYSIPTIVLKIKEVHVNQQWARRTSSTHQLIIISEAKEGSSRDYSPICLFTRMLFLALVRMCAGYENRQSSTVLTLNGSSLWPVRRGRRELLEGRGEKRWRQIEQRCILMTTDCAMIANFTADFETDVN